jgi:hypothetical protein
MFKSAWDNNLAAPGHLLYTIVAAKGLGIDKPTELFVRISSKGYKEKTKTAKKDLAPTWNDIFYIETCPASLDFSVCSPDGLSEKFWGECSFLDLASVPNEVVVERWIDLVAGSTKTKRTISGQLQVRCVRTVLPTNRSLLPSTAVELHYEHRRLKKFRSGDLILYAGGGPQHTAMRLESGLNYSNVGILLELQNKWTKVMEWYVVEATENTEGVVDPFADSRGPGLRIFRLEDRLHSFHGPVVWWVPQGSPIEDDQVDILRRWVLSAHDASKDRPFPPPDPKNLEHIGWKQFDQPSERIKLIGEFYERSKSDEPIYYPLHAPQLIGHALSALGLVDASTTDVSTWTMETAISQPCFRMSKFRILRISQDCHSFFTAGDTDKNTKLAYGQSFNPATSFYDVGIRVPSDKSFSLQAKQLTGLQAASSIQLTPEESNLLHAASRELLKKKKKK